MFFLSLAGALLGARDEDSTSVATVKPEEIFVKTKEVKIVVPLGGFTPNGHRAEPWDKPLPPQALAAYAAKGYVKNVNSIRNHGAWFRFATFSDKFHYRTRNMRIQSKPQGAYSIKVTDPELSIPWMMRCKDKHYLKYGHRDREARLDVLRKLIGPAADAKLLIGTIEDVLDELPEIMESAGLIAQGVATQGASVGNDPAGQIGQIVETVKRIGKGIGNIRSNNRKRSKAAVAIAYGLAQGFVLEAARANPWAMKDGKLDLGKHYKPDPKTWADLWAPGNARPLLYNPPAGRAIEGEWPNR